MKRSLFLAGIGLVLSFAATAQAQDMSPAEGHHAPPPKTRAEVEARVREQFARLDANKDGVLTADELHPHPPSDADRQAMRDRMFAALDKDGNGQISKAEFDAFHADRKRPHHGPNGAPQAHADGQPGMEHRFMHGMHGRHGMMARMMFAHADADHDGKVTLAEAEKAALDRFDRIDANHDGVISDAERAAAHQQMAARFRERRAHWMERKSDAAPPPAPQG